MKTTPKHIFLFLFLCAGLSAYGQGFSDVNWYFTGNNRGLVFGKENSAEPIIDFGKVAQSNPGEKVTITDPISGELIAYSDGNTIFDASHAPMLNGDNIQTDIDGIQAMAVSPVPGPGSLGKYYLFHRNDNGEILATIIDQTLQGTRPDGPPLGEVSTKNIPMGVNARGDGMVTVSNADGTTFWLITQQANGGMIEFFEIPFEGGTLNSAGLTNLTTPITTASMAFHNGTGRIALIPANDTNIQVLDFNPNIPEILFERSVLNSFALNETFGGNAGWSLSGDYVYFSRNNGAAGNVYRFNLADSLNAIEPILSTAVAESFSLKMAPDSSLYHLYRATAGGDILLGRINQADSAVDRVDYEEALLDSETFESRYFASFNPLESIQPQIFALAQTDGLCMNNPIQFYPIILPDNAIPTNVFWDFQPINMQSGNYAPIMTFEEAGPVSYTVTAEINGQFISAQGMVMIDQNDLQVSLPDTTICPGEVLTLDAEPQSGGQGQQGGASGGPYTYLWNTGETTSSIEVNEAGNYWVVVSPQDGCPVYATTEVRVYGIETSTANIWYFGDGAGIDFNEEEGLDPPPRSIETAHAMNAPAGTSTISDQNGDVLFYSNGTTVWNRENEVMPNGIEIGGDSLSAQAAIIVSFIDDETLYYIFTTEQVYGLNTFRLKYSVVDMKEDDGKGDVIIKDVVLFTKSTEKLAAFEAGGGYWVITHEYGTNSFRAYPVLPTGVGTPVISSAGRIHSTNDPLSGQAGMKFSNDGTRLATALIEGVDDFAEVFSFDQLTGEVTELIYSIDLNEGGPAANDQVYDVHFSNGGNKLFATMNKRNTGADGGRILEYRIDTFSTEATRQASKTNIAEQTTGVNFGQMQTGPDGQLYVAVENQGFVGGIVASEDSLISSSYNAEQLALTTGTSLLGLPNFVQNNASPERLPGLSADSLLCVEQVLSLSGAGTSDIDELSLSITNTADNNTIFSVTATETLDTTFVFAQGEGGLYNVSLNIANRCGFDTTIVQRLEVLDTPAPPTIPQAVSICEPNGATLDAAQGIDASGLSFEWTDSQGTVVSTAQTYTIQRQEIYRVTISNQLGCSSSGEVFAGPPFEIQLPPTAVICEGGTLSLDPQVNATNYIWTVTDENNTATTIANERRADVNSSIPGIFTYVVSVEDPITPGCFVNDTTVVTINPLAQGTASNIVNPACGTTNGSFDFDISTTGSYSYVVTGNSTGIATQGSTNGPATGINVSGLAADTYTVQLTDNASGCVNSIQNINVQNDPPDFTITSTTPSAADCTNPTGSLRVSLSANVFPITYSLTNTADNSVQTSTVNVPITGSSFDFEITGLAGGTYDLDVNSSGGCSQLASGIVLAVPTPVDFTTESIVDQCATTGTLEVTNVNTAGATFVWSGPNGFSANGRSITAPESGSYTVTGSAPGSCDVTETITLNLSLQPEVNIVPDGTGCDGPITLRAEVLNPQAGANYIFNWDSGETTQSIQVRQSGTYTVTARNAVDLTCVSTPYSETVSIPEPITTRIAQTPACNDGSDITLSVDVLTGTPTSFQWTFGGQPFGSGQSITVSNEGVYTVDVSDGVCSTPVSINVRRQNIPEGQLPELEYYCSSRTDNPVLVAGNGFATYEWTLNGVPYPQADRTLAVEGPGLYVVTMTTAIGCVRTDTVEIIESCDPVIVAPNAFSPTSTAPNNTFSVFPNPFVANFEIYIYSRWGELVYQSNVLDFKWDGTFNGKPVPLGTYPYVIKFTSRFEPERGVFEQQGAVTVIR